MMMPLREIFRHQGCSRSGRSKDGDETEVRRQRLDTGMEGEIGGRSRHGTTDALAIIDIINNATLLDANGPMNRSTGGPQTAGPW